MRVVMGPFGGMSSGADPEHLKKHVEECRSGDYSGYVCLKVGLDTGVATPGDLGCSEDELEEFRQRGIVEPACQYAEEVLEGNFENLETFNKWASFGLVTAEDLPVTQGQLQEVLDRSTRDEVGEIIAKARSGEDYDGLARVADAVEAEQLDPEEYGITVEELRELREKAIFWEARQIADECRAGEFENLPHLQQAIAEGKLDTEQVEGLDLGDMETWERGFEIHHASLILDEIRTDPSQAWPVYRTRLKREFSRDDLNLTRDEYRMLVNPHPVRYRLASALALLSVTCRRLSWRLRGVDPDDAPPIDLV